MDSEALAIDAVSRDAEFAHQGRADAPANP